jgi:PAS domain-containing protein
MQSAQAGLRKRVQEAARRVTALKARLAGAIEPATVPRILDELRTLVDQLEVSFADLNDALDEQTSRKEVSAAAQRRAETLFRVAPTPCIGVDRDGVIVEINAAAAELLNVTPRHIIGRAFPTFLAGDRPGFLNVMRGVMLSGATSRWEAHIRPRDKGPFSATILVVLDPPHHILLLLQLPHMALPLSLPLEHRVPHLPQSTDGAS